MYVCMYVCMYVFLFEKGLIQILHVGAYINEWLFVKKITFIDSNKYPNVEIYHPSKQLKCSLYSC